MLAEDDCDAPLAASTGSFYEIAFDVPLRDNEITTSRFNSARYKRRRGSPVQRVAPVNATR